MFKSRSPLLKRSDQQRARARTRGRRNARRPLMHRAVRPARAVQFSVPRRGLRRDLVRARRACVVSARGGLGRPRRRPDGDRGAAPSRRPLGGRPPARVDVGGPRPRGRRGHRPRAVDHALRRGVDGRAAAARRRADIPPKNHGDAAAATWRVRGDESWRPRRGESTETSRGGRDVESLRRRVVAAATRRVRGDESWRPRRGESAETSRTFRRDRHALQVRGDAGARGSRAVPARLRRRDGRRDVG